MAEGPQTNPADVDLGVAAPTIEDRMAAFVNRELPAPTDDEPAPAAAEAAPEQDAPQGQESDELTAEDMPDEPVEAQPQGETVFEIVHDGKTHKIESREDQIRYMQQGFDYTQKTQRLAEKERSIAEVLQRAAAVEQMVPFVAQDLATVKALEARLQEYGNVDWIALATNDPLEYPRHRAQYDQLVNGYQRASQQLNERAQAVHAERANVTAYQLQQERKALAERIPEWAKPETFQAGAQELTAYLKKEGASDQDIAGLTSALAVSIARKAMLYDKLKQAKTDKTKQLRTVPPVSKPGAPASSAQAEKATALRQRLSKSHSRDDAAALLLTRMT